MFKKLLLLSGLACSVAVATPAWAQSNLLFILDGSNSMWGQVDGVAKIETAKEVLVDLLGNLPPDTKVGLMAYGHRSKEDCSDVEILSPIGAKDPAALASDLQSIVPKGKTPIAFALEMSFDAFADAEANNSVVLISDGIETCGGDPCDVAAKLSQRGVNVRVHVVGFDVSAEERQQLECIADAAGGRYFNAADTVGFKDAIGAVRQEIQVAAEEPKAEPQPAAAQPKEYFFDDFDGQDLQEHWQVLNPNPDTFIVEDGSLLVVSNRQGSLSAESVENLFLLDKPLPEGDWVMTVKMNVSFQTMRERPFLALFDNKESYLSVQTAQDRGDYNNGKLFVTETKVSRGDTAGFQRQIWDGYVSGRTYTSPAEGFRNLPQPLLLRLRKEGRSYIGAALLEGVEKPQWVELEKLTVLRQKGRLAIGVYQTEASQGETTALIDWVKIETLE